MLQEAFSKLKVFRKSLFSLINLLKITWTSRDFKRIREEVPAHGAASCLKDDLPISVLGPGTSIFADFLKSYFHKIISQV